MRTFAELSPDSRPRDKSTTKSGATTCVGHIKHQLTSLALVWHGFCLINLGTWTSTVMGDLRHVLPLGLGKWYRLDAFCTSRPYSRHYWMVTPENQLQFRHQCPYIFRFQWELISLWEFKPFKRGAKARIWNWNEYFSQFMSWYPANIHWNGWNRVVSRTEGKNMFVKSFFEDNIVEMWRVNTWIAIMSRRKRDMYCCRQSQWKKVYVLLKPTKFKT